MYQASVKSLLISVSVIMTVISSCSAMHCYQCRSSKGDVGCHDPFDAASNNIHLVKCNNTHNTCMKLLIQLDDVVDGRITMVTKNTERLCSTVDDANKNKGCDYGRMASGYMWQCYCSKDGCNHANNAHVSAVAMFGALFSAFALTLRKV